MECKNCGAKVSNGQTTVLNRINPLGVTGEWICQECLEDIETLEGQPLYVHSKTCPSYCDYACNGERGFDLAEQVKKHIKFPHDGSGGGQ
jgi:hypothetical protein